MTKSLSNKFLALFSLWTLALSASAWAEHEFTGEFAVEARIFPAKPAFSEQPRWLNLSASLTPQYKWTSEDNNKAFVFKPFYRFDQTDPSRTHADLREACFEWAMDNLTLRLGVNKVFWGVTESNHLVDIINQTDLVENFDGEDKLGQLMAQLTWDNGEFGTFNFFLLPGSRQRTFPSASGRPRFPLRVDPGQRIYTDGAGEGDLDFAVRYSNTLGPVDAGLSLFRGTSRDPLFQVGRDFEQKPVLIPVYDEITQVGLDLQYTGETVLWKLEAIHRSGQGDPYFAATGGFEYTFYDVKESGIDVGIVGEYLYDERQEFAPTPFTNDVFLGARFAFNDEASSDLLAGGIVDVKTGATFLSIEANRRLGEDKKLSIEARAFIGVPETDFLAGFRNDHSLQIELTQYF